MNPDLFEMIVILRTAVNTDIMIAGMVAPLPNYRLPRALRFSFACPCSLRVLAPAGSPRTQIHIFSLTLHSLLLLSPSLILSRSVFFSELARASTRASPRKASSRAIPVITTTSIFVKSLSPLSSSPSFPFLPLRRLPTSQSFDLPLYKLGRHAGRKSAVSPRRTRDIFQIINFYECRARGTHRPSTQCTHLFFFADVSFPFPAHYCRQSDWICPISRVERKKRARQETPGCKFVYT